MTGGWAATNTLREHLVGNGYLPQHEPMLALALVEAALDAAAAVNAINRDAAQLTEREWTEASIKAAGALAAALRAVREGKP